MDRQKLHDFFHRLDRGAFLNGREKGLAELDQPLPIGFGQTISQPSLVAAMTLWLAPDNDSRVLEIGTGSGYQTAFLAEFSKFVYTVERIAPLQQKARERLESMGYRNILFLTGDGSRGWAPHAPYDRIMVTAAASCVPAEMEAQLAPRGRMLIPVGGRVVQDLMLVTRDERGQLSKTSVEKVRFVELVGDYGWEPNPRKD